MLQKSAPSKLLGAASDVIDSGTERARELADVVAERAQVAIREAELDPATLETAIRRAVQARWCDVDCVALVERARDRERLKAAAFAGLVLFLSSAVVLLIAREIAARRRLERSRQEQEATPGARADEA